MANNAVYIKNINDEETQRETEVLTPSQQLNETIMISLRTIEGIDLKKIEHQFGKK